MRTPIAFGLLVLSVGCGVDQRAPVDPIARVDLRATLYREDVMPVGFALVDGKRYIFDEQQGLFALDGDRVEWIVEMGQMPDPGPTAPIRPPFTDLVAYAPNVFAITALGDGYLLDTQAMTLTQHFCYVPDGDGGFPQSLDQRTDAIALDTATNKIWAQPITRDLAGTFVRSEISMYDAATGFDERWLQVPENTAATAMLANDGRLVLGQGSRLSVFYSGRPGTTQPLEDLARFGVKSIDGMAIDHATNTLVVVDSIADAVFDIDLAQLDNPIE
ncbi:MAG: hypothetical protein AB7T06_40565 [Kofleriaceae bacterium]